VGVSWGGVLTLELARILEAKGAETRVVLLDGALDTIRSMVELLNEGSALEANLICRFLQISCMKVNNNFNIVLSLTLTHSHTCARTPTLSHSFTHSHSLSLTLLDFKKGSENVALSKYT
jgi:hypothetical protein